MNSTYCCIRLKTKSWELWFENSLHKMMVTAVSQINEGHMLLLSFPRPHGDDVCGTCVLCLHLSSHTSFPPQTEEWGGGDHWGRGGCDYKSSWAEGRGCVIWMCSLMLAPSIATMTEAVVSLCHLWSLQYCSCWEDASTSGYTCMCNRIVYLWTWFYSIIWGFKFCGMLQFFFG